MFQKELVSKNRIPAHNHNLNAANLNSQSTVPSANSLGRGNPVKIYSTGTPSTAMADSSLAPSGGSQPHNNMMPYLTMYFCIALQGVFPPRG